MDKCCADCGSVVRLLLQHGPAGSWLLCQRCELAGRPLGAVDTAVDGWLCGCGNTADSDGFYAWTAGRQVEPTPEAWDGTHYQCDSCMLVFAVPTRAVSRG